MKKDTYVAGKTSKLILLTGVMMMAGAPVLARDYSNNTGASYNSTRTGSAASVNNANTSTYGTANMSNSGYNNSQRDPAYSTSTTSDCVNGGTGTSESMDCTRNRASRHTNDTSSNTDTGYANGSTRIRSDITTSNDQGYRSGSRM